MKRRNKKQDLMKLADAFYKNLDITNIEIGGWGIDDKRPFGNSYVVGDILKIIGMAHPDIESDEMKEVEEYVLGLYYELGPFLKKQWKRFRKIDK